MPWSRIRIAIAAALTLAGLAAAYLLYRPDAPPHKDGRLLIAGSNAGYVDSSACAGCHRKIWDTYSRTGMGRSFARLKPEGLGADFETNNTFYHPASDRYYTMFTKDGKYYQRRYQKGFDGKEENVLEKEIHFVVGSGNHARTYLHRTPEGRIFELPVAWYSDKGGYWAMNPGFDSAHQPDFRRQVVYECLSCHTGYPEIEPGADASGREPLFPGRIPEGIDCQRCHGPGRAHIEAAASGTPESIRAAIVNPKRLALDRQLEVCMQCHLETTSSHLPHTILRFDRGAFSYRPGTPLGEFAIHFDHPPGSGYDDKFEIAHQAYRLRKSACFQKSNGRMTCTTCHDPHDAVRGEQAVQHYTGVCRGCHAQQLVQLRAAGHPAAESNCLECHMPKRRPEDAVNVIMTDHYIQRRIPRRDLRAPLTERQETEGARYKGPVVVYYPASLSSKPDAELYVALAQVKQLNNLADGIPRLAAALRQSPNAPGEFYFELAEAYDKAGQSSEAIGSYQAAIQRKPDFRPAWLGLGRSLGKAGKHRDAVEALEKAAAAGPEDATIQNDLGLGYLGDGRTADALGAFQRAVTVDPENSEAFDNLGNALRESGNFAGAEQAYRSALRAQPDSAAARLHLANLLAVRGNAAEAAYHYQKAITQNPQSAAIRVEYATALAGAEHYDQALEQFQAAALLDPNLAGAQLGLGDLLALRGQLAQAASHYQKALALDAGLGAAHLGLASALEAQGRHREAILHLQQAAQSSDANAAQSAREALQSLTAPPGLR